MEWGFVWGWDRGLTMWNSFVLFIRLVLVVVSILLRSLNGSSNVFLTLVFVYIYYILGIDLLVFRLSREKRTQGFYNDCSFVPRRVCRQFSPPNPCGCGLGADFQACCLFPVLIRLHEFLPVAQRCSRMTSSFRLPS